MALAFDKVNAEKFEINPKLCFWNNQIWSITDKYARLEINNVESIINPSDSTPKSYLNLIGQVAEQHNPIEASLETKGLRFIRDDLGREGIIKVEVLDKIKKILEPITVKNYMDLE